MTAPAEDPRSGEACGEALCTTTTLHHTHTDAAGRSWCCGDYPYTPPAAGRGDTDSGGEMFDSDVMLAEPAARPAGDRAQPTQELREATGRWLCERRNGPRGWSHELGRRYWLEDADALLAGPLAALLDAQAAVDRVEAAINRHADNLTPTQRAAFARALGGGR